MAKEHFKEGDKVVPINPEQWRQGNNIGTVVKVPTPLIIVEWERNGTLITSYYLSSDIKRACQIGEQRLFPFMYEN